MTAPSPTEEFPDIDSYSEAELIQVLQAHNIPAGSGSFRDYNRAKDILFRGRWIDPLVYDRMRRVIETYCKV